VSSKNNLENAKCTSPVLVLRTIAVTPEKEIGAHAAEINAPGL